MTPEEREKAERRARRQAELEDGCCVSVGGLMVTLQKFPPPNTDGMTPEERDAAWARWRAAVDAWVRETNSTATAPAPAPSPVPPGTSSPPEVPIS
jgi:hypothetical protein